MKTSLRKRATSVLVTTAVLAGAAVTMGANNASAAPNVRFMGGGGSTAGIVIVIDGQAAGVVNWRADGDRLSATDRGIDGYYIDGFVGTSPVRKASTKGHSAPYTDKAGGNLPENKTYTFWACVGKGTSFYTCSDIYKVKS
ncbi:hypothetical protein AB8O64_28675 [Streptomyces sp. QH1-20]|uniref:hypothetical protein n=1 Tax=Streptomyces sp. QH1-20 TaxID=3240934 RepID=UPI003519BDB1